MPVQSCAGRDGMRGGGRTCPEVGRLHSQWHVRLPPFVIFRRCGVSEGNSVGLEGEKNTACLRCGCGHAANGKDAKARSLNPISQLGVRLLPAWLGRIVALSAQGVAPGLISDRIRSGCRAVNGGEASTACGPLRTVDEVDTRHNLNRCCEVCMRQRKVTGGSEIVGWTRQRARSGLISMWTKQSSGAITSLFRTSFAARIGCSNPDLYTDRT